MSAAAGMAAVAPGLVTDRAEARTARRTASAVSRPSASEAAKTPRKQSPAPVVSTASTGMPGTTSFKGMISGQKTYPAMQWPEQAYVQIDLVGQFTAAAGCAIYEGGAWPEKWNYAYFTAELTLNIVHQHFVTKDGVSYTTRKEQGREETEFIRSTDMWFRPIETRVGPDGALYVIDFYNQAVIHNDTRGPLHGPANAAVRPDRDHYFGRIWKVQHKQARKLAMPALNRRDLPSLLRVMATSPNAHVKQTAWRLAQEKARRRQVTTAWRQTLLTLAAALPENAWLTQLQWRQNQLEINGLARAVSALKELEARLQKLAGFHLQPMGSTSRDGQGLWQFTYQLSREQSDGDKS